MKDLVEYEWAIFDPDGNGPKSSFTLAMGGHGRQRMKSVFWDECNCTSRDKYYQDGYVMYYRIVEE